MMVEWDPGSIVSQDLVAWERVAPRTLALVARVQVGACLPPVCPLSDPYLTPI